MQSEIFTAQAQIEDRHWWFAARRRIFASLAGQVLPPDSPLPDDGLVLDVGCGTGGNIAAFSERYPCVGIDPTPEAIELCRQRFPQVEFICGMAPDDLNGLIDRVRLVLMTDVLEHVPDDFQLLSKLFSTTQPGTYFLLTVPADDRLWSAHDEVHGHYRRYTRERFQQLWQDLPVTPLLVSHFNWRLYSLVYAARTVSRIVGGGGGAANSDLKLPSRPVNSLLEKVFSGEEARLRDMLQGTRRHVAYGVSLIALLRREPGAISVRNRPQHVPPDRYQPA